MDICICLAESLGCSPETITTLLIGYAPTQNKKFQRKKKLPPLLSIAKSLVLPGGSDGKESTYNSGDLGSIPGSGRYPREENGNPLQNSCLNNPMDREAWQATVHGVAKSWTRLND